MTDYREFITIVGFDSDALGDHAPGDFLDREFEWLNVSGIFLDSWALVDGDIQWERYLRYLVQWAIDHSDNGCEGMSPVCYDEWRRCEDGEVN